MMDRFSKKTLAKYISNRLRKFDSRLDRGNGTAQVKGKGEDANRDYAEFRTLLDIAAEFELDINAP